MYICQMQALAQCENTLSKLGVSREAVDDTAGAAQASYLNMLLLIWEHFLHLDYVAKLSSQGVLFVQLSR